MELSDNFEATKFRVKKLLIVTEMGEVDITNIFEELSIFDNLFLSCMSGNVLIRDSINLIESLKIDGNEDIVIEIDKGDRSPPQFRFSKKFKLQKLKDKKNVSQTTVIYVLHFVSEEYLISQKSKVRKFYQSTYSSIASSVIGEFFPKAKVDVISSSSIVFKVWPQTITPFEYLDWIARRAVSSQTGKADFLFYETEDGYNFESISEMYNKPAIWTISLGAKDLELKSEEQNELIAARDFNVIKQFNLVDGIEQGIFGGAFMMFDPLTRQWNEPIYSFDSLYGGNWPNHANVYPNIPKDYRGENFSRARSLSYSYQTTRKRCDYILSLDPETATFTDNTEDYVFSRQHHVGILSQKRLLLTISGNFRIQSGKMIYLEVPEFKHKKSPDATNVDLDLDLTGRYLITGVRHVIKYDKHETVLEIASDSTMSSD